jgi:acyl-CoA synthetase (AMP-forming)/AMP-acid ligase II
MTWRLENDVSGFQVRRSNEAAERYRTAGHWRDETLADIARTRAEEAPSRVLLIEGDRRLTRGQAWDQALRLSNFFLARGLKPGDVVSFQLPNWIEAAVISLAARMNGLVINPVPPNYRESETSFILGNSGSKLIFIPETFRGFDYRALIDRIRPQLPNLRDVIVVRGSKWDHFRWEEAISSPPLLELPKVDPAAVMMAMYTSGTTAQPKGVMHSHQTYGYKVRQMGEVWGISSADVALMPSPITHITGAFWCVDMPWVHGASGVLMDVWSAEEGIRCIETHGCTVIGGATPFLQQLLESGSQQPEAVKSLRIFFCGGTSVSPELIKKAAATFPNCLFFRLYGCTEVPTTTMGIGDQSQVDLGAETDGIILPPTEVKILRADGDQPVADGEEGEIAVRGPEQFLGYLNVQNSADFDDAGYFRTGDLGCRVYGDYLVITGRKKDIIIRSGENISPKEVEDILYNHPAIADIAIVAMPSPTTGEKGCAFIVPRQGATVDLASIRSFLETAGLARQKFPEHLVLVVDLPRVPSGKVRKDALRGEARKIAARVIA